MSWDDLEDIIFDGTEKEINNVRCVECGSELEMSYFPKTRSTEILCLSCGIIIRASGAHKTPNFYLYQKPRKVLSSA